MKQSSFHDAGTCSGVFFDHLLPCVTWRLVGTALSFIAIIPTVDAQMYRTAYDDDGFVTVNGERRFILGSYTNHTPDHTKHPADAIRAMADAGFNLVGIHGYSEKNKVARAPLQKPPQAA